LVQSKHHLKELVAWCVVLTIGSMTEAQHLISTNSKLLMNGALAKLSVLTTLFVRQIFANLGGLLLMMKIGIRTCVFFSQEFASLDGISAQNVLPLHAQMVLSIKAVA
jgi:hypothetical protein